MAATLGQTNTPPPATPGTGITLIHNDETDNGIAAANRIKELMREHKLDEALAAAQAETQNHPEHMAAWYSLGDVLMVMQRYQDALVALQKAAAINPKFGALQYDLGFCLLATKQVDPAIDALSRAVDGMPDVLPVWIALYQAYAAKNDIVGMEKKFEELTVTYPKNPNAWFMLGQVQIYEQLPDSAIASWQKAVDLKPDYYEALKRLGLTYGRSGQTEKSIGYFARAAAIKPDAELVNNLGYAYLSLGQTDKAIEALKHALELDPKYEKGLYNLTDAYSREKQWALAWQTAQALAQINPKSAAELTKNFPPVGSFPLADTNAPPEQPAPSALPEPVASTSTSTPVITLAASPSDKSSGLLLPPSSPAPMPASTNAPSATPPTAANLATALTALPSNTSTNAVPEAAPSPVPVAAAIPATSAPPAATTPAPPASATTPATASAPTYAVAQPPAWVTPLDADSVPDADKGDASVDGGVDYLLVDNQQIVEPEASFTHYAVRLTNEQGLEYGSDLRAEFDPNFQTLTINWLKVKRDGVWSDRLRADSFQLIRREQNLDSQMLDGRYSAICHLQDVRVGDVVDFAYTVTGANPVFGGKFASSFTTGFLRPVHLFSNQLKIPADRDITVKEFGGAPKPVRTTTPDGSQLLAWRQENAAATVIEPGTPPSYDALPWVQLSEFKSWSEIAQWGCGVFSLNDSLTPELQQEVDDIKAAHSLPALRAMAVIQFVQNEVRYLGIEMGPSSYRPTPAAQVMARRFGDCKDKTQLCVVMLHAMGIGADPALVNTTRGEASLDLLPSPLDFDHAIVALYIDSHLYWVDLTRPGQCGQLRDLAISDFKRALPLSQTSTGLARVVPSPASLPQITVDETYDVPSATEPAALRIHAVYKGSAAEAIRGDFNASSRDEVQKAYLDYYGRVYPQIKVGAPLRFQDFPDDNHFELWQEYTVPGLWTRDSGDVPYRAAFVPFSIASVAGNTTPMPRTAPYRIYHPTDVTENMEINLFTPWPLEALPSHIATPNFDFAFWPRAQENSLHFQYHYQSLASDVPPSGLAEYNNAIERVRNELEYHLTYTPGVSPTGLGAFRPNWMGIGVIGAAFAVALVLSIVIYCIHYTGDDYHRYEYSRYEGIGGWLIVFCIGLVYRIFAYIIGLVAIVPLVCDQVRWDELTRPGTPRYDPYWAPTFLLEGVACSCFLVFWILAAVLFFQKRFTFPYLMVTLLVLNLLYHGVDHALASSIAPLNSLRSSAQASNLVQLAFYCAVWIPYFLSSKRVKATFRN